MAESAPVTAQPAPVQPRVVAPKPVSVQPATPSVAPEPVSVVATTPESVAAAATSEPAQVTTPSESSPLPAPGWYHDPYGSAQARWWDGQQWTANTA